MTRAGNSGIERQGVSLAMLAFERLEMAFRPQDVNDFGIDAHAEILAGADATGRLLAIQLKSGSSYFEESCDGGFVFRFDTRHFEYWSRHSLPVIVVLCDVEQELLFWQRIASDTAQSTGKGWKVIVPHSQRVDAAGSELLRETATHLPPPTAYSVLNEEDVSHGTAKRYSVRLLLNQAMSKPEIAAIVRQETLSHIGSRYYRDRRVESRWGDVDAHVVWTFVYASYDDFMLLNHLCRSWWIAPGLPHDARPAEEAGENVGMSIMMEWFPHHEELARALADQEMNKSEYLQRVDELIPALDGAMQQAAELLRNRKPNEHDPEEADVTISGLEPGISGLSGDLEALGMAPLECRDLDQCVQALAAHAQNAVLPYSSLGKNTWNRRNAMLVARAAVKSFFEDLARFHFEREKV